METKTINIQFQRFLQTWICSRSVDFQSSSWNVLHWVAGDLMGLELLWLRWDPQSETAQAWVWFYTKTKEREGSGEKMSLCNSNNTRISPSPNKKYINLYRILSFSEIKHTQLWFFTLKHIVWNMVPNAFIALWLL